MSQERGGNDFLHREVVQCLDDVTEVRIFGDEVFDLGLEVINDPENRIQL